MNREGMIYLHNHTDKSNFRLVDSTNKTSKLIDTVIEYGGKGVAITDHEVLSSHVEALRYVAKGKEKGKIPKDFKLILGNEIYLVDSLEDVRDNYESGETKFYHFVLLAKDRIGHNQLRELSSIAWSNSFYTGQMERVPTVKADIERIVQGGHIVASTACLGGELPQYILKLIEAESNYFENPTEDNEKAIQSQKIKIHQFLTWGMRVFGKENFFIELQPSATEEQVFFNIKANHIANAYGIDTIVTTDTHFLTINDKPVHEAYLKSKEGDREVVDFYDSTYIMSTKEIIKRMGYLDRKVVEKSLKNTLLIGDMIEEYDLYHPVVVPEIELPEFELKHSFKDYYDKLPYIKNFAYSDNPQDRYYLYLVEEGVQKKEPVAILNTETYEKILFRINMELQELWMITEELNTALSSYYITTRQIINIMWNEGDSLVGVARGSVTGWYTAYLMEIVQMNPMKWNLPHWRHIHHSRVDLPKLYWALVVNFAKGVHRQKTYVLSVSVE